MFQKGRWYLSDIIDFSNLNVRNSREILIYYGIKQPISQTYLSKKSKEKELSKIKSLCLGEDLPYEMLFKVKDVYNKLIEIKMENVECSKAYLYDKS